MSSATETTDLITLAARFVNGTSSNIFLTGKAGTGKTTFLRDLALRTHKKFVIVAPTGIAALNAQGVTIHSQFLLPLGTFLPDRDLTDEATGDPGFYTPHTLARRHPLNSTRRQVLRDIDLLIIDEVSMLRADLLDAIDYRMRAVKGNYRQSFGGIQVLMIGDLYQLPPVVKDHEWSRMSRYYGSPHFFEAKALQENGFVYIEFDKIFRQRDKTFIRILNNLRNNTATPEDIEELNARYQPFVKGSEHDGVITVTTHNYRADQMNRDALNSLPGPSSFFRAEVEGDFPESLYPLPETLELKPGARIMFVKNDTAEGKYYNGRLAEVSKITDKGVEVKMADTGEPYTLRKERWENKKYTIAAETRELEEEVVGTYTQYPVKLAWAITVHKSQGLTFDKAVIDVGNAFAPGQVYVALSRLRSLDGLILRTRIGGAGITSDEEVVRFSGRNGTQPPLPEILKQQQVHFLQNLLPGTFDFSEIVRQIAYVKKGNDSKLEFEDESMKSALDVLSERFTAEEENTARFRQQLANLLREGDETLLLNRIQKGSDYYTAHLFEAVRHLLQHIEEVKQFSRTKTYQNALAEIDLMIMKKLEDMEKAAYIARCILRDEEIQRQVSWQEERQKKRLELLKEVVRQAGENPKNAKRKSGRVRKNREDGAEKKPKKEKGATYKETYALLHTGLSAEEIAVKRELALTTIEGHLAKGILSGEVDIHKVIAAAELQEIEAAYRPVQALSITEVFNALNGKYTYGKLRMVQAMLQKESEVGAQ